MSTNQMDLGDLSEAGTCEAETMILHYNVNKTVRFVLSSRNMFLPTKALVEAILLKA